MNTSAAIYAVATLDTKGAELQYIAEQMRQAGVAVRTVDVGTRSAPQIEPDVTREVVLGAQPISVTDNRGQAVTAMGEALANYLVREVSEGRVLGVLGIGGSGGTALITAAMRALPIGLPKYMVSTVASGNTLPYVDCSDIVMHYSVVDVAGLNVVSKTIFQNAALAIAGMVRGGKSLGSKKPTLGMTMFGVTTACVDRIRAPLESKGFDCLVFHATGTGGRAMERLVDSGMIQGVIDVTTTEVADEIAGGIFPCGPKRFETLLGRQIPFVLSLGALDMVNFGAKESVPEQYQHRNLFVHNAQVTLMRTNANENRLAAQWIAEKLNQATSPWTLVIPGAGLSALDAPGQPFYDPDVDAVLFESLEEAIHHRPDRKVVRTSYHINDPEFSRTLVEEFELLWDAIQ